MQDSLASGLEPLLDLLRDRWPKIREAWRRDVLDAWPGVAGSLDSLERINVDAHVEELEGGSADGYLERLREQGAVLGRARVPFPVLMQSLHLFEERCGDEVRPALAGVPGLWSAVSALDRLIHAGVASLADGYFTALSDMHRDEMVGHIQDTTATLCHRINNPLATIQGRSEMLLGDEALKARRESILAIARSAQRIADALDDLRSATCFSSTPYLASVRLIDAGDGRG